MSNERKKVLDLLAKGDLTAEQAETLLDNLRGASGAGVESPPQGADAPPKGVDGTSLPKFMCVHVDSADGDKVDVRVPIGLIRTGIKLSAMMPRKVSDAMAKKGLDLSQLSSLSGDELIEALRTMVVNVASHDGDQVKIYCE